MNPQAEPLPLRDIHLPEPLSWWPPAPGWWMLSVLLLLVAALAFWLYRRYRQRALRREAQRELHTIAKDYRESADARALSQQLSIWLRRISISCYPRQQVAGLSGEAWLEWLDKSAAGSEFQHGVGRVLIEAPYAPHVEVDGQALLGLCERWLIQISKVGVAR